MKYVNPWILVLYAFIVLLIVIAPFRISFIIQMLLLVVGHVLVTLAIMYKGKQHGRKT